MCVRALILCHISCWNEHEAWPQRVRGSQWFALKALGVGPAEASTGADLGGSSKYSSGILED